MQGPVQIFLHLKDKKGWVKLEEWKSISGEAPARFHLYARPEILCLIGKYDSSTPPPDQLIRYDFRLEYSKTEIISVGFYNIHAFYREV